MLENLQYLIKLDEKEEQAFGQFIKTERNKHISPAQVVVRESFRKNQKQLQSLLDQHQISEAISLWRQVSYDEFLLEESKFNGIILTEISAKFAIPEQAIHDISQFLIAQNISDLEQMKTAIANCFGRYSGVISPYIYQLCLSNTQSRRSRAGKTFEAIIYALYEHFGFTYESQSSIGRAKFQDLKLGKVVDSILPSTQAFLERRQKTIVGSMKTTLRERWQEVVEEVVRSNLPNIYLLTVDDDISLSKATQMAEHNITLVVLNRVKQEDKLSNKRNIISFESYFFDEIPHVLEYWRNSND